MKEQSSPDINDRSDPEAYRLPISSWPESERPRERLKLCGAHALSDTELLAILIRTGVPGKTAVDLARTLLSAKRSLGEIAAMSVEEIQEAGIGESRAIALVAAFELARRLPAEAVREAVTIRSPEDIVQRYAAQFRNLSHEEFWIFPLNAANRLLRPKMITKGILNSSLVHPRECFHEAIKQKAAAVIFLHNHPSGNQQPSGEDVAITRQLVEAGKIIGIAVHDHIIIAGNLYSSLAEQKIIS
jgi:DNA repair protein RadC